MEQEGIALGLAVWTALAAPPVVAGGSGEPDRRPSFSGSWALQAGESDDPRAKMKEAMGERRGRGPRGGGPAGGGPRGGGPMDGGPVGERGSRGGPGGAGGPPPREQMAEVREAMEDALRSPETLLISQDGVSFETVEDDERVIRLYADGRKNRGATGVERKTRWESDTLVTEIKVGGGFGSGVKITEVWALAQGPAPAEGGAGTSRLAITTRLSGGFLEKDVVIRRVYAREEQP